MRRRAVRVGAALAVAAGVALAGLAACMPAGIGGGLGGGRAGPDPARGELVISTSSAAGAYYAYGRSLAEQLKVVDPDLRVTVETSSGSVSNLRRLTLGIADLGLTTVDTTDQRADDCLTENALDAADERRVPLAALGRIYDDYLQIVVRADSPVRSVPELAGRPVAVGGTGSGTALVACRVLAAAGVRVDERPVDVEPGMRALAAGSVDAVFWSGALPTRPIADTAARVRLRLVPLGGLADTIRTRYGAAYRPATIPPGPYRGTDQVATLACANLLVARADADPAMVNSVLRTIFTRRDQLAAAVPATIATDRRTAILTGRLPLHRAAVEFYRRTKP